eukprot:3931233-Pyramimonas_sp.AAC.1
MGFADLATRGGAVAFTAARARGICIVYNAKVAMLAWELKWTFSGDQWDFQVTMGSGVFYYDVHAAPHSRRRRRARARVNILHCLL